MSFYAFIEKAHQMEQEGKTVVRFDIGDTNIASPLEARQAAMRQLELPRSSYGPAAGQHALREAIALREGCEEEEVVVGPGSKHLIFALLNVLAKKGDSILVPTPTWPAYGVMSKHLGLKMKEVKTKMEEKWQVDELSLSDSRFAIVCNPVNPTGSVHKKEMLEGLVEEAQKKKAHVILDEAYRGLAYTAIPTYDNAIRVRSFSKEFNMEGWRLAYAIAPVEIAKKISAFNQFSITCVPDFIQMAGVAALGKEKEVLEQNKKVWRERQKLAGNILREGGFEFAEPESGIYLFMRHPNISDAEIFALRLLEKSGVAVSAGGSFGPYPAFLRICPNLDGKKLEEACRKIVANIAP